MSAELEPRILEGRVFTDGVAQETARDDDGALAGVKLTCLPGYPAAAPGAPVKIALPEPVTVKAGETITVSLEFLDSGSAGA